MPTKKPNQLPESLQYLQPFVRSLAKFSPEELNEDVDASRLDAALRKRLHGLDEDAAAEALSKDRELLERWLTTSASQDHPAYWVLGYLSLPDIAEALIQPPELLRRGPEISFDAPDGWRVKVVPFRLDLKKGKLVGTIMAIDKSSFQLRQRQQEHWVAPSGLQASRETQSVCFDKASGNKYVFRQFEPAPWKRVDYVLSVPGGFVSVMLDAMGANFDEAPFEAKLHTLRLSAS